MLRLIFSNAHACLPNLRAITSGTLLALAQSMRSALLCWCAVALSCSPYVHSPPGRTFPLEAPKALYPRETAVQIEGGGGVGDDVSLAGVTVRVRHGIVKQLDGSLEGSFLRFSPDEDFSVDNPNIFQARLGIKYAIIDHVAITAGLAGGGWTGGGFMSPDASMIFGYENPYCVPFFDLGGYVSIPVRESSVVLRSNNSGDFVATPAQTWGWQAGTGLRIPLSHEKGAFTKGALLMGVRFRGAYFDNEPVNRRDSRAYILGSGAIELVFGPGRKHQGI